MNLAKLAESTCSRSNWTRIQPVIAPPNANAASGRATPAGRLSPSIPRAQKINAPRTTLRIKAAADPPIAEIPCSSIRCRPLAEAWIAAARRNRARWRFLQYGPTSSHTLENADDQNAIALLRPKSHTQLLQDVIDLGTSTRFNFGDKRPMQICFGQHSYGGPNVISRATAYAKLFSRSHGAVLPKEATEWPPDTIQVV